MPDKVREDEIGEPLDRVQLSEEASKPSSRQSETVGLQLWTSIEGVSKK